MKPSIVALAVAVLMLMGPGSASAQDSNPCRQGFADLQSMISAQVGQCLDEEWHAGNGDALQPTTGGMLFWRKADNWTGFTDGYRTWISGPCGLQQRLNTERFSWEPEIGGPVSCSAPPVPVPLSLRTEGLPLAKMQPAVIKSRDGLNLVSYYTLPLGTDSNGDGRPDEPLPTVLSVHGGPWSRDQWGFDPTHQVLANRGYAVLSVNFRGSTGFGKEFINAGNLEWGARMHDDLLDAVNWAIREGIADPGRVAIMGGSYGGYATLWGLAGTPEIFACGVDLVGPSNLVTLLESIPPYWQPQVELFAKRVGDHRTEEGRALLTERSPLTYADRIQRPLLIAQGANDPRVKQAESDRIVQAMQQGGIPVTYLLYPDEGHGFGRAQNSLSFFAVAEAFLSQTLGGRHEPIGDAFKGSSITAPVGAEKVPGLAEALSGEAALR